MKEKRNLHLKVQELCDCYATTDPLKEMSKLKSEPDTQEAALKWLALAALHGINAGAKKISIRLSEGGEVEVTAKYREARLPSPGKATGGNILKAIREITHIDAEKGALPLALGIRDSRVDLDITLKKEEGEESVTIRFPE